MTATPDPSQPHLLHSPLLGDLPHAFTTRKGGVSSAPFASLNLGRNSGLDEALQDPAANLKENRRRALAAIGRQGRTLAMVHQVHGPAVHLVRAAADVNSSFQADAIVTDCPDVVASVRVADCVPVLLAADRHVQPGAVVAAVHAGWRGVAADVVGHAIAAMRSINADRATLRAAIGPCISADAFEVGEEVAVAFDALLGGACRPFVRRAANGKAHINLQACLATQLTHHGVNEGRIDTIPLCTVGRPDLFFSHRRDRGVTGRMMALIAL